MTDQNSTSHRWNNTAVLFCTSPCAYKNRRGKLFLNLKRPVTVDDVPDLYEIAMGISGFAGIERSDRANTVILVFTDYDVTKAVMHELKDWLLYFARQHEGTVGRRSEQASSDQENRLEAAMAVHSSVRRLDEDDH